jgi:hypothetical protein
MALESGSRGCRRASLLRASAVADPKNWTPSPLGSFTGPHNAKWFWLHCHACGCRYAVPRAPYVIYFGPDMPATVITEKSRCLNCRRRTLMSYIPQMQRDNGIDGFEPFPAEQGYCAVRKRIEIGRTPS